MRKQKTIEFDLSSYDLQIMPHSHDLEACVLGLLIDFPDFINVALRFLNIDGMFHGVQNRIIWLRMVKSQSESKQFSESTLIHHFELINDKDLIFYIRSLRTAGERPDMFKNYCLKLNEFWIQRSLLQYGYYVNVNALRVDIDALDLLGEASD